MEKLSIKKAVKNDYLLVLSLILVCLAIIVLTLYFAFGIRILKHAGSYGISNGKDTIYEIIWFSMLAVGTVLGIIRYLVLKSIFQNGVKIKAVVTYIQFYRDRGQATFSYNYAGQEYQRGIAINRTNETKNLSQGDEVALLIDENNPKHFLIHSLYCEE